MNVVSFRSAVLLASVACCAAVLIWNASGTEQTAAQTRFVDPTAAATNPSDGAEAEPVETASLQQLMLRRISPMRLESPVNEVENISCPAYRQRFSKSADSQVRHETTVKYTRYVKQYCNSTGLLQMHFGLEVYIRFMDVIAKIVNMQKGFRLFDWGCGCGTMLNYYAMKFNTTGVGIDITDVAVAHARRFGRPGQLFCHMDGADLRPFPSDYFDAVVSWATLYHVRRTLVQCHILHELVRILKPGAVAYIGHLRTEKTQEYWKKGRCRPPRSSVVRLRDSRTFHMPAFRRNDFFSLVVRKFSLNESDSSSSSPSPRNVEQGLLGSV